MIRPNTTMSTARAAAIASSRTRTIWITYTTDTGTPHITGTTTNTPIWTADLRRNTARRVAGNPADQLRETMSSIGMKAAVQIADRSSWLLVSNA